jgi:uncharacterized RDD family membrane protein YckC
MSYEPQPTGAVPPPPPARPGELLDRFVARIIDGVLIAVVLVPIIIIITVATSVTSGSSWLGSIVTTLLGGLLGLGYFAYMESSRGQTIGKMVMKLRTLGPNGGNPTIEQAAKRNIWMALSLIGVLPLLGGLIAGLAQLAAVITIALGINSNTATRQAWHDTFAGGTQVVKIG